MPPTPPPSPPPPPPPPPPPTQDPPKPNPQEPNPDAEASKILNEIDLCSDLDMESDSDDSSTDGSTEVDEEEDEKPEVQARVFLFCAVHLTKRMNKRVGQSLASFAGKTSLLAAELEGVHASFRKLEIMYGGIDINRLSNQLAWEVQLTMSNLKVRYTRFFKRWKIEHLVRGAGGWP
jgi:hypothetical protein